MVFRRLVASGKQTTGEPRSRWRSSLDQGEPQPLLSSSQKVSSMDTSMLTLRRANALRLATLLIGLTISHLAIAQEETETETTDAAAADAPAADQPAIDPEAAQKQGEEGLAEGDIEKAMTGFTQLTQWGLQNQYTQQNGPAAVFLGYTGRGRAMAKIQEYEAALQ